MAKLTTEDRKILIALGVVMVVLLGVVGFLVQSDSGSNSYPSSYGTGTGGAKAAFLLLQQTGYDVRRFHQAPKSLEDFEKGTTLILLDPFPQEAEDISSVQSFVEKGGRIVGSGPGIGLFVKGRHTAALLPHFDWQTYKPQEPSALTRGISAIEASPELFFSGGEGDDAPFKSGDEIPVVRFNYGKGEIIWLSSSSSLTNEGIARANNLQLLLNCVGDPTAGTVLWDEYFHEGGKTLFDTMWDGPLRWAFWQTALLGLLVCFTWSRRFGPLRRLEQPSRLATMDFVQTLAELYKSANVGNVAVEVVYQRFRSKMQQRFLVRRTASLSDLSIAISHKVPGRDQAAVAALLDQAEQSIHDNSLSADKAAGIIQQLHGLSKDLGLTGEREWKH
jgi:hypothetical protein